MALRTTQIGGICGDTKRCYSLPSVCFHICIVQSLLSYAKLLHFLHLLKKIFNEKFWEGIEKSNSDKSGFLTVFRCAHLYNRPCPLVCLFVCCSRKAMTIGPAHRSAYLVFFKLALSCIYSPQSIVYFMILRNQIYGLFQHADNHVCNGPFGRSQCLFPCAARSLRSSPLCHPRFGCLLHL